MKNFPSILNAENMKNFPEINFNRLKCYLRRDLYEHIISHKEDDYFLIDEFNDKRVNNLMITKKLVLDIIPELEKLGWKCKISFGGTGLFIYSTEKPPKNCFDDTDNF